MPVLSHDDLNCLQEILSTQAALAPLNLGPVGYFRSLLQRTNLPPHQKVSRIGGLTGSPDFDARELLLWADNQGGNPVDPRYTTLGSLLKELLPDLGMEEGRKVVAMILARGLYRDPALITALQREWNIPVKARSVAEASRDSFSATSFEFGPNINWLGTQDEVELQSFFRPEPDFQDVGFLMRAIQRAASVCRISFEDSSRLGTGFIVGRNQVLTNFHVMVEHPFETSDFSGEIQANGRQALLHFGVISGPGGVEQSGPRFKLNTDQPVLKWSPVEALDYALLQVEDSLAYHEELPPVPLSRQIPARGEALNILQHPGGAAMQLALSSDGIVTVIPDRGLVQYSTRAIEGSSGSPCFNDDWQVVALHHAQRSRSFGIVREGILMKNILEEIATVIN